MIHRIIPINYYFRTYFEVVVLLNIKFVINATSNRTTTAAAAAAVTSVGGSYTRREQEKNLGVGTGRRQASLYRGKKHPSNDEIMKYTPAGPPPEEECRIPPPSSKTTYYTTLSKPSITNHEKKRAYIHTYIRKRRKKER